MSALEAESSEPSAPPAARADRLGRAYALAAVALGCAVVALLLATSDAGYARDEGFYFQAATRYGEWFKLLWQDRGAALRRAAVDAHFVTNHEHPALMKSLFAISHLALDRKLGLFSEPGTAFRFPAMVLAGAMTAITFHWGARKRGALAGFVAALSLLFMPRVFFHAHLACFDVPIAALFVATFYAYDRTLDSSGWGWPLCTGLLFGLALNTKHNSWFLPIAFATHACVLAALAWWGREPVRASLRRPLIALGSMALLGPLVLLATWPWLWFDTWARFKEYAAFHLNHEYYNMELLGENYWQPPFPRSYAPLMTLATVPLVTLAAALGGAVALGRPALRDVRARAPELSREHATFALWTLGVAVSYGPWLSSGTPIFGGTKHWMPAYPFLALFAGVGLDRAVAVVREELELAGVGWGQRVVAPLFAAAAVASPIAQSLAAHPWGLSAYTPLVGGASGAATLGLNRTFWGYTTGSLTDYLNREVPPGGRVYPHDTAAPAWDMLQRDGRLRKDIRAVGRAEDADVALYHHEMHMQGQEYQAWVAYGTVRPDVVAGLDGVPVVWAYKRPPR